MKKKNATQMLTPTTVYADADQRYRELVRMKREVEERMKKDLPGKIHIVNSAGKIQFYLREDPSEKSGKYIRRSEDKVIRVYLQKAYDEKILKLMNAEIKGLERLCGKLGGISMRIRQIYADYPPAARRYINPVDVFGSDFAKEWQNIPFQGKEVSESIPVYETKRKEKVRSKSELTIANMLAEKEIPYKYECPLTLRNGTVVYPDFTVLNVKERKEIYWEHRGMMDDREYARQAVFKLKSLMKNGFVIGDNLIITEETSVNPLGTNEIELIIDKYFL